MEGGIYRLWVGWRCKHRGAVRSGYQMRFFPIFGSSDGHCMLLGICTCGMDGVTRKGIGPVR